MSDLPPIAPIVWHGRDGRGNLVEVTADTDELTQPIAVESGAAEVTIYQASVTLTDAQIKALPTTGIEIVAPTETLAYSSPATELPVPIMATVEINSGTAYTNVHLDAEVIVAYGADQSWNLFEMDAAVTTVSANSFFTAAAGSLRVRLPLQNDAYGGMNQGALQDNGLFLFAPNAGSGNLTGGNAANTLKVTVWYGIFEV